MSFLTVETECPWLMSASESAAVLQRAQSGDGGWLLVLCSEARDEPCPRPSGSRRRERLHAVGGNRAGMIALYASET